MNSNNDLNVKKISRMLEMGGTMLAKHCDICGAPIFRYKGEEFCPICKTHTPLETHTPAENMYNEKVLVKNTTTTNKEYAKTEMPVVCNDANYTEKLIFEKIIKISQNMQQETEYVRILEQLKLIKECVNILKELKELQ